MKKIICTLLAMIMLLSCGFSVYAEATPKYGFGYYIDKVEYIDDNIAEATIVFTSQYGSDADMECVGFLAVYDDITNQYLNVSYKGYSEYKPFLDKQRYEVKQTVEIPDLTKMRYNFKFFIWDSTENVKPEGFVDLGNNSYILKKDDFTAKDTYYFEGKIMYYSLDPDGDFVEVMFTKYDENFDVVIDETVIPSWNIKNPDKLKLFDYAGLLCNMTIYQDKEADALILKNISVNTKKNDILNVNPMQYQGINGGRICYFADETKNSWCNSAKVEYPFVVYMNGRRVSEFFDEYILGNELQNIGVSVNTQEKIISNNKNYKFVDTNNNGYYDTFLIENSASFVVDKIIDGVEFYPEDGKMVYNSDSRFSGVDNYNFMPSFYIGGEDMVYTMHDTAGRELSGADVKKGDVLTIRMSVENYYRYYDITVSDYTVGGIVEEMRYDDMHELTKYVINGNLYSVNSRDFGMGIDPGVKGTFTLTPEGKIIKADLEDDFEYGIVTTTTINNTAFSCEANVQILNTKGERKTYKYAPELKINYQYVDTTNSNAASMLFNENCYIQPGSFAYYKMNENGEIYYITTYEDFTEKYMMDKADCLTTYRESRSKLNGKMISDNTPIWCIAEGGNYYNASSYVFADKTVLTDDSKYNVRIIWENDTNEAKLVLITNLALEDETEEVFTSNYGVVVAVSGDSTATGANGLSFMIVDENGDMKIYSSTYDICIDNVPYYNNAAQASDTPTASGGGGAVISSGTAVIYETNASGKIKNIYTTDTFEKEDGITVGFSSVNEEYVPSKIGNITLTDNTSIVCIDKDSDLSAYACYNSASLNDLTAEEVYDVSFIYNVETMEAEFAFIKNLYIEKSDVLTRNYGVLINSAYEYNAFGAELYAQVMGTDGKVRIYSLAPDFHVDGAIFDSNASANILLPSGVAMVFETNAEGQIKNIYTDKYSVDEAFSDLGLGYISKFIYEDGKINGYTLDESTVIIGCEISPDAATSAKADMYGKYDVSNLNSGEYYNGTIIYNAENDNVIMFFVTDFMLKPSYASSPMVVSDVSTVYSDGKVRDKITGYVDGKKTVYTAYYDDVSYFDVRGYRMPYEMPEQGEAFRFVANENNQIIAMDMIIQNYNYSTSDGNMATALVALKPSNMAESDIDDGYVSAVLVDIRNLSVINDGGAYSMVGHAGIGKVNEKFEGEIDLFVETNIADISMLQSDSNLFTVYFDENTPAYFYGWDYKEPVVSTLSNVKSFEELGCIYDKLMGATASENTSSCEDIVYVYNYDGNNTFNYVFDPNSNSN